MELITNFIAGSLGDTTIFKDITGTTGSDAYGKNGNITYADVDAIRIKTATLSSISDVQTLNATDPFTLYAEYICTSGTGTIDSKGISSGDYFVPSTAGLVVPANMTFETTGNYVYPFIATWLPTTSEVGLTISLAELNQSGNTTLEDSLYTINYEVYVDQFTTSQAAVVGNQYMVKAGTCGYLGNTYRAGEVFIATDTTSISVSGSTVVILSAACTSYFILTYNMYQQVYSLLPIADDSLSFTIFGIGVQLDALAFSCATGNVSYTYAQGLLDTLQNKVTYLVNNN